MVFGRCTILRPFSTRRSAFLAVPPPPMQTSASSLFFAQVLTIVSRKSREAPLTSMRCGLMRLVPRIVPPMVRIPASAVPSRGKVRFSMRPRKPSRMPTTSISCRPRAALPTPRMAALSPGQSPPAVRIPIRLIFFILLSLHIISF